ncbi:hypothetical protein [Serratia sp. OLFL2]|nr:hypothetical protein [Serratia sp. OLFL2]
MNKRIALCAAFGAALFLSACSSAVKKPQPYGDWQDANSPAVKTHQGVK